MDRKLVFVVLVAWLTLPLTALSYWRAWDRMPARIAVHFDVNWQPNGWTSREGAMGLALATSGLLLLTFTFAIFVASRKRTSVVALWATIIIFYVAIGLVYGVNQWILNRSLVQNQSTAMAERIKDRIISRLPVAETVRPTFCDGDLAGGGGYVRDVTHG
jgi:hypothetical protein